MGQGSESVGLSYRRQQILKYGRESRHNVISRRDNLILSPDKPPTLQVRVGESFTLKYLNILVIGCFLIH